MELSKYHFTQLKPNIPIVETQFNRLIIIGNGFDIAHGLKSSFKDFIFNYCFNSLNNFINELYFEDEILTIKTNYHISDLIDFQNNLTPESAFHFISKNNNEKITISIKSRFFNSIIKDIENKNWVDIELLYYQSIKNLLKVKINMEIKELNSEFEFIKNKLVQYLWKLQENTKIKISDKLTNQFEQKFNQNETNNTHIQYNTSPEETCFLNFNYTNIAQKYISKLNSNKITYIPIHGELNENNKLNSDIIFGFGDEMDSEFSKLEDSGINEVLSNEKSIKYLQKNNYKNLIDYIGKSRYQVQIFGHSCGLSDRTLLNTIFEHVNCISIKQFYYEKDGIDDFESKIISIKRHFQSRTEFKNKIVNKQYCEKMAQPMNETNTP